LPPARRCDHLTALCNTGDVVIGGHTRAQGVTNLSDDQRYAEIAPIGPAPAAQGYGVAGGRRRVWVAGVAHAAPLKKTSLARESRTTNDASVVAGNKSSPATAATRLVRRGDGFMIRPASG
jgi:hypothetical protein